MAGFNRFSEAAAASGLEAMPHWIAAAAEMAGLAAIVLGAGVAMVAAVRSFARDGGMPAAYHAFRTTLARGILLGLEFLVAADIIGTVAIKPTIENLQVLAVLVLIRTFLSFALEVEIDGRLPWRKTEKSTERR